MALEITKKLLHNSLRLKGFNYSQPGAYFVTICTDERICYFGNIVDGIMISFPISEIVREIWLEIPERFQYVDLDAFVIMPNHFHGIIIINKEWRRMVCRACKKNHIDELFKDSLQKYSINSFKDWPRRGLIHQTHKKNLPDGLCGDLIHQTNKINNSNKQRNGLMNQNFTKNKNWILMKDSSRVLGKIIRYFKAKSAKVIHENCFHRFKWQRNYYEHVVRSYRELKSIREYIVNNPIKWALDRENRLSKNFNLDLDKYFKDIFG